MAETSGMERTAALPWRSVPYGRNSNCIIDDKGRTVLEGLHLEDDDADFIVKAVNSFPKLIAALKFYADEGNHGSYGSVESDNGYKARSALSEAERAEDKGGK